MESNEIFIGRKSAINYVLTCSIMSKEHNEIYLRARGDNISKAVDVALIFTNRFVLNFKVAGIEINTQTFETEGNPRNVSVMNICLRKI